MTLADLYRYSSETQCFAVHAESNITKTLYRGLMDDCPQDLLEQEVNYFRATDWDCVLVELCI